MNPQKYRKKPVEVEAVQFKGGADSALEVIKWIMGNGGRASYETVDMDTIAGMIGIQTLEGRMHATPGDYIICGVQGEFYPCKPGIFEQTYDASDASPVLLSDKNRQIIEQAYDDGDGNGITLVATDDPPWFVGIHGDFDVCDGMEHDGVLYVITPLSGGGLVSVIVGEGLIENDGGTSFHSVPEAKAYIQGLVAK